MTEDEKDSVRIRMHELMFPVEQQILMCDDREDVLIMACAMMQRCKEIFDTQLGKEGRKLMFRNLV